MKNICQTVILIALCLRLYAADNTAISQVTPETKKTEVVIIGTIHSRHYENPKYSAEILKQIIFSLKPDAILNELPLSHVNPNGRPRFRDPQKHPEAWAADTVATLLSIKQIPFDRSDRQENFRKTKYFERQKRSSRLMKKWIEQVEKQDPNSTDLKIAKLMFCANQAEYHMFTNAAPEIINSEAHDAIIRAKKSLWYDILPTIFEKYPGYQTLADDYHFARDQWRQRNRIMADNIIKTAKEFPDKRLVVVTGATHRYVLRDLLIHEKSVDLKEYWEIIDRHIVGPRDNQFGKERPDERVNQDRVERSSK